MTINGTNDAAKVSSATVAVDETDSAITTSGILTSTDVDNPDNAFTPDSISGTHGDLTINANGHWVFTANSAFNQLNVGDKVEETFTVTSVDGTRSTIKVTINGTNDAATVSSETVAIDETDTAITTSGTLTSTDVDNPDNAFTASTQHGTNGDLTIDANGHWVFTANSAFNQLNVGDKVEETFTVTSVDGTPSTIKVTINGTNDAASVSSATVTVDETDSAITTSGTLTSTDVDNPDNAFTPDSISGTHGDLTIDAHGHWVFTANSAFNQLNVGDKVEETFTVTSVDSTQSTIKVTINGTNDAATVSSATVAVDETDKAVTTSGTLTSTDVDNPDNAFTPDAISGTNGNLTMDANGHWTFTANSAFNQLNVGDKVEETFTVSSVDGTPSTIKVTINGTNDAATVSSETVAIDETDTAITTSGTLTSTDVDNPDNAFTASTQHGTNGDLTIDANGHWVFTANSAFNQLNVGDKVEETFTVTSVDGTPSTIKVTINGTNDAASVSSATVTVDETDSAITTSGTLTSTDVDNPDNAFTPDAISGTNGDLTIDANGHWTFTANSAFNQLNVGDKVEETFTVTSVDGTQSTIKVTINGTNDSPTISGTSSGAVIDQGLNTAGTPDATGSLIATDIDKSDTITWAINQPQGRWGTLSIDQNGHWHYQLDNSTGGAADKLAAGERQSESFWITVTDSAGATVPHKIVIDVQGSNDKPIVSAWTQLPAGKEDQPVTIKASDLLTHASDVDSSDVLHVTNLQATHGSLTDNKDGTYTFTPDKDFNGEIRLTYDVVDGHGGSVSTQAKFDLTATPDNAIITDAQTNADLRGVTEDRGYIDTHYKLHYDGKLNIQDPDAGEAQFDPNIGPQTYQGIGYDTKLGGHILLMRDGHYTYTLDNRNIQNLAQGEVKHDSSVIRSADGTTHTIELTVHGTNDAPTISAQSHSVTEGGSILHGQMVGQDIDTGATLIYSAPQVDGLVVNPDGSYSFSPAHSSYQSLASGITKTLTVPVTVTDEHNASSTQNLSITITGVNNSAVIGGVDTGDVTEGNAGQNMSPDYAQPGMAHLVRSTIKANGKLTISDTDTGEAEFDTHGLGFNYSGQYGDLLLRKDGTWFYHADTGQIRSTGGLSSTRGTTIDQLGENQTLTDTITVYSKDGTSHDIVITIHGSNDRPYCASEVQLNSGKEDLTQTITATELLANTVDVDANDAGKLTIANLHADHGSIQDNHDGTFTFTPDHDFNGKVHFTYDVKDAHGGVTPTGANLHLQATGDAATITGVDHGNVTEDRGYIDTQYNLHFDGKLDIVDPDQGEAQFDIQRGYTYHGIGYDTKMGGWVLLQQDGTYTYTIDNRKPEIQNLGSTETLVDKVTIHSVDGTSHEIQITIHGTNDDPKVSSVITLPAGTEDTDVVLHASDLLANATDIDHNDVGKLSVANLIADHGNITDNHDGTFTFHPSQDYNGNVSFTYDVQDAHGGSVSTSASITLAPTRDSAVISGDNTGTIIEDNNVGHSSLHPVAASGLLRVTDPDAGQDHFQVNRLLGEQAIHDPFGGFLRITPNGAWGYEVANSRLQSLAEGEVEKVVYRVYSADHTAHDITITVTGTNDRPTITATTLAHGTEDTHYQMQASQFGFNDVDTGDTLHSIAITDLPPAAQGKFVLDGHDITAGQSISASDIAKLQFVPATDFNGDVQFKFTVNDGHASSVEATNTLHIDAVSDAAQFTGRDTGDVHEGHTYTAPDGKMSGSHVGDRSPDHMHGNIGKLWNDEIHTEGHLNIVDADTGEGHAQNGVYHGTYGEVILQSNGDWSYYASIGQDATGRKIDHLGQGESITDTVTVKSADGTTHDIHITIHGDNDRPYCSSEVQLNSGKEDLPQTITATELLANTVDVDTNDTAQLSIANLLVDHGTVVDNKDGTFTFTPDHNFNGQVHFTYDVKDAHGGTTHTGATTTLAAVNDAASFTGDDTGSVTEDQNVHPSVQGNYSNKLEAQGHITTVDPDAGESGFDYHTLISAPTHPNWAPYQSALGGQLEIDQQGRWHYYIDNRKPEVQSLGAGETLTDTVTIQSKDGTPHVITLTINGTNDDPVLSVTQTTPTTGTLTETDVDVNDTHTFSVVSSTGQFGSLSVDPDSGAYVYTANGSVAGMSYNAATHTYHGTDIFEVKVTDNHGGESSKFITFDANGHVSVLPGQTPTISTSVPSNPLVTSTQPSLPTAPPNNAVTVDLATSSDTGTSDTDNLTKDSTPTVMGHTDIPYSQVTIYDGSTPIGHAVSDASGQYSVAVSSLSEGDHNLSAKALAPSSVLPATSSLLSVHIDTQVHVGIQTDPITADNVINAQESNSSIDITGSVSGDYNAGDIVTLDVNGTQHTGVVDAKGHYSIAVPGSELIADADQKIEASVAVTDSAGNSAHASADVTYQVDTQVSIPTITFENAGADNLYSKAEIARGQANTITATVTPPGDAKIGEHLVVNGQDHVLDAHTLQHGIQIEVHPGSNVQATMTDEHGNTTGSQGFAASAIPEPIIVRPPSGSHQVSGTLGVPPLLPSLTPVPTAQSGWRIHLPNGQYVTSHHGQYGTLTIDPQTGDLHYQEQANVHTGPHGSASGLGQHEDKFEVALQGTNQDEIVAHVNVQILSHGPGNSGKLNIGTEVVDMTITPATHTLHPTPSSLVQHDEPDVFVDSEVGMAPIGDSYLDLIQYAHQEAEQKDHHNGVSSYLDALGIKPDATSTTVDDQPADMDIVLAQVDQQEAATHDQAHLDMSDALEHHDGNVNHNQDDEHHHHNDIDGLPDIDPNP
ncbi:VCBS domain-containing protein [Vibrio sp. Isolate34]|uniref:VCBS domain-containing protein n=1 Tax=Vibrio sp. Isolate34 TaxID=2908540 RepID=UPI001EFC4AD2|nr:VCBS domain-containing protein [Vibrio sp. Isolate34]